MDHRNHIRSFQPYDIETQMNLKKKKVLVVGFGKTGEAVCEFCICQGARVKVSEKRNPEAIRDKIHFWAQKGVVFETGRHELESFLKADLIVPSPGVPPLDEIRKSISLGIPVISEIELASWFLKGQIVGITGSNGKSTTASLTHKILLEGGLKSHLAGNIGIPLISFVDKSRDDDIFTTELSSFQLAYIGRFRAHTAVVLNITPDHLDWHNSFEDYYEAKKRLLSTQRDEDAAVLNRDDPLVWKLKKDKGRPIFGFSQKHKILPGCFVDEGTIILAHKSQEKMMNITEIPLLGPHNRDNVMASALVGHILGLPSQKIKDSIRDFKGLPHRLEKVTTIKGVEFYNDSKATNVDAAQKSLESFNKKIVLILGGRDKGGDFKKLRKAARKKVRKAILIGEAREKIQKALANAIPTETVSSWQQAVARGYSSAKPGDVVLLAPACTSFDQFRNFEERGNAYKNEVRTLHKKILKENKEENGSF